jgi:hypothetical protein
LHRALVAADTPYAGVVEAVCATLPPERPGERDEHSAPERPLLELVGLDAYPTHLEVVR